MVDYNSIRRKRLYNEIEKLKELDKISNLITIEEIVGDPPEKIIVRYTCKGIASIDNEGKPKFTILHRLEINLGANFPVVAPQLRLLTTTFHPNISQSGIVCHGGWDLTMGLDDLCIEIGRMIQYKSYNYNNPLFMDAAIWAKDHLSLFPIDNQELSKAHF